MCRSHTATTSAQSILRISARCASAIWPQPTRAIFSLLVTSIGRFLKRVGLSAQTRRLHARASLDASAATLLLAEQPAVVRLIRVGHHAQIVFLENFAEGLCGHALRCGCIGEHRAQLRGELIVLRV